MAQKRSLNIRRSGGFTLVELIVVLLIVAILATASIPALAGYIDQANEKKLIANCRACVMAAQTLSSEQYGEADPMTIPSDAEIRQLAEVDAGIVTYLEIDTKTGVVKCLTYQDEFPVTYTRFPTPNFALNSAVNHTAWAEGQTYAVGDTMVSGNYILRCLRAHTTGTTSRTRNPVVRSNKSTWEVIGTQDGSMPVYSSTVRFAVGMRVTYQGHIYIRTAFNLVGGQVPLDDRSSDYWTFVS